MHNYLIKKTESQTFTEQEHNQKFFKTGEVSCNKSTSIKISSITYEKKALQRKISDIFLLDALKHLK